ncbi:DUF4249 domain-containing protein [Bacteroides sp. 214]|uniref:DUF4249 domain-containing protein n=1 Tax=Bacteroides sp. 214 TaxID=2302935 RepID=UPI0013D4DBF9|nr:DUF4249 domain-containing protein [Bacteroides sp. 214]NDW11284.1 DUF4249 domain-containing protein [Bacteroides sp. 214]
MKKIIYFIPLFILLMISSCISEFNASLPESDENILVVEGNIHSDSIISFYFSKSFSLEEDYLPGGYNDVEVKLHVVGDNGYRSEQATYVGNGEHLIYIPPLEESVAYGIEFQYEGDTYQSTLIKPVRTPEIDSISFSQAGAGKEVFITASTHTTRDEAAFFMWSFIEDWEYSARYPTSVFYDFVQGRYVDYGDFIKYYCWKKSKNQSIVVGSTEKLNENRLINKNLYSQDAQNERFSILYSTRVVQQGISKGAYEYYLDLIKSNEGMGGLFTPLPSGIEGNISCNSASKKVIGYIDVSMNVTHCQRFISANEILRKPIANYCSEIESEEIAKRMNEWGLSVEELIISGTHPYFPEWGQPALFWTGIECLDCTRKGGTKNKPSFWPNAHE